MGVREKAILGIGRGSSLVPRLAMYLMPCLISSPADTSSDEVLTVVFLSKCDTFSH